MKTRRRKRLTSSPNTGFTARVTTAVPTNSQRIASIPRCIPSASRAGRSTINAVRMKKKASADANTGATSSRRTCVKRDIVKPFSNGTYVGVRNHQIDTAEACDACVRE
jgi:hypothetical protein